MKNFDGNHNPLSATVNAIFEGLEWFMANDIIGKTYFVCYDWKNKSFRLCNWKFEWRTSSGIAKELYDHMKEFDTVQSKILE